jgi:hypothetical protein
VSETCKTGQQAESDEPHQPPDEPEETDHYLQLIIDAEDQTPEEAGYGHGV